jgi:hypothetical protein
MNNPRALKYINSYFSKNDFFKLVLVFESLELALYSASGSAIDGGINLSL